MSKFDFVTSIEDVKSVTDPLVRVVTRMEIALREQEESFLLKVEELETKVDELQTKVEDLESHVSEVAESDKELMTETVQELLSGGTFTFDYQVVWRVGGFGPLLFLFFLPNLSLSLTTILILSSTLYFFYYELKEPTRNIFIAKS